MILVLRSAPILSLTLLSLLATSCAYLIPADPNPPRNNTVLGDPRRPQLNYQVPGPQSALPEALGAVPTPVVAATPIAAPVTPVQANNLPPVDAATQAQVAQEMAQAAPAAGGERRVPIQNQTFQVSAMGYPQLNSVPARPAITGPDSAKERLISTREVLELERKVATENKSQLAIDAAAEPSLLSELPATEGIVPPVDPVQVAPVTTAPLSAVVPPVPAFATVPLAARPAAAPAFLPPAPVFAPPAPLLSQAPTAAPAIVVAKAPETAMELVKRPVENPLDAVPHASVWRPVAGAAKNNDVVASAAPAPVITSPKLAPAPVFAPVTAAISQPEASMQVASVAVGDFDPMALSAAPAPSRSLTSAARGGYANGSYIAPSRYAVRRF